MHTENKIESKVFSEIFDTSIKIISKYPSEEEYFFPF